jgi:predicted  nucleic acid-binding Zn-ribbon protein
MRSFLFENIWMLSRRDRQGRRVEFHRNRNLIQGRNHTGKSSLIKTLFLTLGARPQGKLIKWDEDTISLVDFRVDGRIFRALHQRGTRALFDEDGRILVATGDHAEWSAEFASVTGFNLVLTDKDGRSVPADSRCFFLPFYINQDGSWQAGWDTFIGLQQFKSPIGPILEYFSGIKPPEYYEAKAKRDAKQRLLDELNRERLFLNKAQNRFGKKLPFSGPKIDPENFKLEIERLTSEITELNKRQEKLREQAVKERELLASIYMQINLANEALHIYEADAKYLRSAPRETLVCPVCNAEHSESFLDLLTYAEDARSLRDITVRLHEDADKIKAKLRETDSEISNLERQYRNISQLLDTRRGTLQFRQVVESLGAEQAFRAFEEERAVLEREIGAHSSEVDRLSSEMSELTDRKRSSVIMKKFRQAYAAALFDLNLPPSEQTRLSLTSRPSLSGSGGPRSILAYYAALWDVCCGQTGSFLVPLVVDSPNQQGQDDINLPKVIEFVSTKLPHNTQLILGSELEVEHLFDNKILLDQPYQLLDEQFFEHAEAELTPMVQAMYAAARESGSG